MVFYLLLLLHLLYDFHWQGDFIASNKGGYPFLLIIHALTWALLLGVVLIWDGIGWWQLPFLFVTHVATDYWKCKQKRFAPLGSALWIDQAVHLVTIIIVSL